MGSEIENGVLNRYTEEPRGTEVVIPDGVTCIGDDAFSGCRSLTGITIRIPQLELRTTKSNRKACVYFKRKELG